MLMYKLPRWKITVINILSLIIAIPVAGFSMLAGGVIVSRFADIYSIFGLGTLLVTIACIVISQIKRSPLYALSAFVMPPVTILVLSLTDLFTS